MLNANLVREVLNASYPDEIKDELKRIDAMMIRLLMESYECGFDTLLAIVDKELNPKVVQLLRENGWIVRVKDGESGRETWIESPKGD